MKITPYARVGRSPLIKAVGLQKNSKKFSIQKLLSWIAMHPAVFRVQITKMWNLPNLCLRRFRQRRNNAAPAARLRSIKQFTRNM